MQTLLFFQITLTASVEPFGKVRFKLTYQELLNRRLGHYEQIIHVNPGQVVKDFKVEVFINESLPLAFVKVPAFKTDPNAISDDEPNPYATITQGVEGDESKAHIEFQPPLTFQEKTSEFFGLSGELIIQYDVDRKGRTNDIQVIDGMFVHFFVPDQLTALPKHVILVLDISGSMYGEKILQTKDAVVAIMDDLTPQDSFNILTFNDNVEHWASEDEKLKEGEHVMVYPGQDEVKSEALRHVLSLEANGGTNIHDSLIAAIDLAVSARASEAVSSKTQPIIIFLTDGEPTSGLVDPDIIKAKVFEANQGLQAPIYGLAFGVGADFSLIKAISLANQGFARRIYEGLDATIQLENFYGEISSPLLSKVKFDYVGELKDSVTDLVQVSFNKGNEFIIAGKLDESKSTDNFSVSISAEGVEGRFFQTIGVCPPFGPRPLPLPLPISEEESESSSETSEEEYVADLIADIFPDECISIDPEPKEPQSASQTFIERLWAFLTIKNLLKEQEKIDKGNVPFLASLPKIPTTTGYPLDTTTSSSAHPELMLQPPIVEKSPKEKALELALKYNFVTPITSLVVVQPSILLDNDDNTTVTEEQPVELLPIDTASTHHRSMFQFSKHAVSNRVGGGGALPIGLTRTALHGPPAPFRPNAKTRTTSFPRTTTSKNALQYFDYDYADADMPLDAFESSDESEPPSPPKTSCSGSIHLFNSTRLRGEIMEVMDDTSDLGQSGKKLTSLRVEGDCCWEIFSQPDFEGGSVTFRQGEYPNAADMGRVFRGAFSVKKLISC